MLRNTFERAQGGIATPERAPLPKVPKPGVKNAPLLSILSASMVQRAELFQSSMIAVNNVTTQAYVCRDTWYHFLSLYARAVPTTFREL